MNVEIKQKWIAALTSGKYKQTEACLKNDSGFCCLGVLTDLYIKEKGLNWNLYEENGENYYYLDTEKKILDEEVIKWAGLELPKDTRLKGANGSYDNDDKCLASDNDNGKTFKQIAKIIEEKL